MGAPDSKRVSIHRTQAFLAVLLAAALSIVTHAVPAEAHAARLHAHVGARHGHAHARRSRAVARRSRAHARRAQALARRGHGHAAHPNARRSQALARRAQAGARRRRHRRTSRPASPATPKQSSTAALLASVLQTPCANTELRPTPQDIAAVEAAALCLVDQERARNGELPLQVNARLAQAATAHSEEMVNLDYFAHVAPDGLTPLGRDEAAGYIPNHEVGYTVGENIAWGTLQLSTPSAIVAAWIASPEHLANILDASYRETGMGVAAAVPSSLAQGQPGAIYAQEFGVIVDG